MSGGPKRTADKVNTIGIVMIGICGAVLVYVSIAALQAFYSNDTADVQTMADYGGQDTSAKDLKAKQFANITTVAATGKTEKGPTYSIKIDDAMKLVVAAAQAQAKTGANDLVPMVGTQSVPTIQPIYGRPKALPAPGATPAPADGAGSGSATTPADGAGSAAGSGSAAPAPAPAPAAPATGSAAPAAAGSGAH